MYKHLEYVRKQVRVYYITIIIIIIFILLVIIYVQVLFQKLVKRKLYWS